MIRSASASARRDLPTPGSAEIRTTRPCRPSPAPNGGAVAPFPRSADQRRGGPMECLEPAFCARANHLPDRHVFVEAFKGDVAEIPIFEQAADLPRVAASITTCPGPARPWRRPARSCDSEHLEIGASLEVVTSFSARASASAPKSATLRAGLGLAPRSHYLPYPKQRPKQMRSASRNHN